MPHNRYFIDDIVHDKEYIDYLIKKTLREANKKEVSVHKLEKYAELFDNGED